MNTTKLLLLTAIILILCVLPQNKVEASVLINWEKYTSIENGIRIIHLPAGVYNISETIRLPSNTILEGEGDETILRAVNKYRGERFITNRDFRGGNENITLRSLKIEVVIPKMPAGEAAGILRFENVDNLEIKNLTMIIDSIMYGIDLAGYLRNAIIEKCTIINKGSGGVIMIRNRYPLPMKATFNILVRDNNISSVNDEPLAVFGWLGHVRKVILEGNKVAAEGASFGITAYGINTTGHTGKLSDVVINKNNVRGGKHGAIGIIGGARDISVTDNIISLASGDGIFIHAGGIGLPEVSGILVRGNKISDTGRHGILATGSEIRIEGNKISRAKESGVYVYGSVTVIENQIEDSKPGILVDGGQRKVIKRNRFRNAPLRILDKSGTKIGDNVNE